MKVKKNTLFQVMFARFYII